jgi:hypothetical protein
MVRVGIGMGWIVSRWVTQVMVRFPGITRACADERETDHEKALRQKHGLILPADEPGGRTTTRPVAELPLIAPQQFG